MMKVVLFCVYIFSAAFGKKELEIDINPITSYIGGTDTTIECNARNSSITKPQWMIIYFDGHQFERPLVTLTKIVSNNFDYDKKDEYQSVLYKDEVIDWGSQNDVENLRKRVTVTGSLGHSNSSFLRMDFKDVECDDEGRYTCKYAGLNDKGELIQMQMAAELIVYSYHGRPTIHMDGQELPNFYSLSVKPDDELNVECDGIVGKPPVPVYWLMMDPEKGIPYRELTAADGVGTEADEQIFVDYTKKEKIYYLLVGIRPFISVSGGLLQSRRGFVAADHKRQRYSAHRDLPMNDLCRFTSRAALKFELKEKNFVVLKCSIGVYYKIITVHRESEDESIMKRKGYNKPVVTREIGSQGPTNDQRRNSNNMLHLFFIMLAGFIVNSHF